MRACTPVLLILSLAGCGPKVDLKQTLQLTDLSGGYFDAGVVEGRNKLVPSVTFTIRKNTDTDIRPLSLNVAFKKLPAPGQPAAAGAAAEEDWEEAYIQSVAFSSNATQPLTIRPKVGYTGDPPQSRVDMLKNSHFQDIRVHIFAKHSASQWVEIGHFDLPRRLLTAQ